MADYNAPMPPPAAPNTPPVNQVLQLRKQGLSNNQIIQTLQNQGFESNLIFDALNQADLKGGVESIPATQNDFNPDELQNPVRAPPMGGQPPPMGQPPVGAPPMGAPPMGAPPMGAPPMSAAPAGGDEPASLERIEEIAEAIIDEKWNEIVKSINKIIDWKDRTETKITRIEQIMSDLRRDFDNLTKGVLGKIGEYDQNLSNIGSEIKAMDQVFQKVLPSLTENVHALDQIAKSMKKK